MNAFSSLAEALNKALDWGRAAWDRSTSARDAVLARKADIDRRHVERRDLSADKRPR